MLIAKITKLSNLSICTTHFIEMMRIHTENKYQILKYGGVWGFPLLSEMLLSCTLGRIEKKCGFIRSDYDILPQECIRANFC